MIFVLEDTATILPIFVTENVFVAQCLRTGIFDLKMYSFDRKDQKFLMLKKILEDSGGKFSMKQGSVDLSQYPSTAEKARLAAIRGPVFQFLIDCADEYRSRNRFGYGEHDMLAIARALEDPKAIEDYAQITGVEPAFAQQELALILETKTKDDFKIFTMCEMWRLKINACTTAEETTALREQIKTGFRMPGMFDD